MLVAQNSLGPVCPVPLTVRGSHTRYCNATCQHDHWRRGHKQICKRIHRGGNAEQYHADKKYNGENRELTFRMRLNYARALYLNSGATLDHLREAVTTFEDVERTARRVLGGAHPLTSVIEVELRLARAALTARETPGPGDV